MRRLTVASEHGAYEVIAQAGSVSRLGEILRDKGMNLPRSVVSNTTVGPLWARSAAASIEAPLSELEDGEEHKGWPTVHGLIGGWLDSGVNRDDSILAVGGGMVTDTAGFAAAVFLRGIDWIAVPTTLLAMVDASVGGKTGVNLERGKNLIGAFWPPRLVVVDVKTLSTLPQRELRAGLAEVVKTAWIGDRELLSEVPSTFDRLTEDRWEDLVLRCVTVKAQIVSEDEREAGRRAALNLGHTLGHALEAATSYRRFLHGEAVAWGILGATRLARRRELLSGAAADRLVAAVAALGPLPSIGNIDDTAVRAHLGHDKKRDREGIAWVLPTDEGVVLGQRVATEEVIDVFRSLQESGLDG
jgi:3-dehydroquinate synthase